MQSWSEQTGNSVDEGYELTLIKVQPVKTGVYYCQGQGSKKGFHFSWKDLLNYIFCALLTIASLKLILPHETESKMFHNDGA